MLASDGKGGRAAGGDGRRGAASPAAAKESGSDPVVVCVATPSHQQRRPENYSSRGDASNVGDDEVVLMTAPAAFPTSSSATATSRFRGCGAVFAQAFQYTLTEPGMALMSALILFSISLVGLVTAIFIAPHLTTNLADSIGVAVVDVVAATEGAELPESWMPDVVSKLQNGLDAMLPPALLLSGVGVWVLVNAERRRQAKWLVGYGTLALLLSLGLFCFLATVVGGGQLRTWQDETLKDFLLLAKRMEESDEHCTLERKFACSGFSTCCVTNTSDLGISEGEWLTNETLWRSLCFVTRADGTAVRRQRRHGEPDVLETITGDALAQCGTVASDIDLEAEQPTFSTACLLAARNFKEEPTAQLTSCEDYFVGHFSATIGFNLCLLLGMTICSVVSGTVAIVTSCERPRTTDFMPLNAPSAAVKEAALESKSDAQGGGAAANRKRS